MMYRPNSTLACTPLSRYFAQLTAGEANVRERFISPMRAESTGLTSLHVNFYPFYFKLQFLNDLCFFQIDVFYEEMENDYKYIFLEKSYCPKHCHYFTYDATGSFVDLEKSGTASVDNYSLYSRVHVYYSEFSYRQYEEVKVPVICIALGNLGNVYGCYWGMSVISFCYIFVYVPNYFYWSWKARRDRRIRIALATLGLETVV